MARYLRSACTVIPPLLVVVQGGLPSSPASLSASWSATPSPSSVPTWSTSGSTTQLQRSGMPVEHAPETAVTSPVPTSMKGATELQNFTTASLTPQALQQRQFFAFSFIGVALLTLVVVGFIASVNKKRSLEVPWIDMSNFECPTALDLCVGTLLVLAGLFILIASATRVDALFRGFLTFVGVVVACAGAYYAFSNVFHVQWKIVYEDRYRPGSGDIRMHHDRGEMLYMRVNARASAKHNVRDDKSRVSLQNATMVKERLKNAAKETMEKKFGKRKQLRIRVSWFLFLSYVAICNCAPAMNASKSSCNNGFFWEDHGLFFSVFCVTKLFELVVYFNDKSLDGELHVIRQFMPMFIASFVSYTDGYQDALSIQLAGDCAKLDSPDVDAAMAGKLANSMQVTYWVGVVGLQWAFLGFAAWWDPSGACLAKLLHMDVVAHSIELPEDKLWLWNAISWSRTLGEDLPQASQQGLFVAYVKPNWFMIVSIVFSVLCSIKSLYDAAVRVSAALGDFARAQKILAEEGVTLQPIVKVDDQSRQEKQMTYTKDTTLKEAVSVAIFENFHLTQRNDTELQVKLKQGRVEPKTLLMARDGNKRLDELGVKTDDKILILYEADPETAKAIEDEWNTPPRNRPFSGSLGE